MLWGMPETPAPLRLTEANLAKFTTWMLARGRLDDTARIYCSHLRGCAADPRGITHRLLGSLAPNTKRTNLAALAAWAKFSKDKELEEILDAIRLPPARRVTAKHPIEVADWKKIIVHLRTSKMPTRDHALRHVMVIVAIRGLRCSDALRIRKKEILTAITTGTLSFEGKGRKRTEFSAAPFKNELVYLSKMDGDWEYLRDLVSSSPRGAANRMGRRMKAEAKKVGVAGVYPHRFRRTYATNFLQQLQGDPRAILKLQRHMNWESLNTAAAYADFIDDGQLDQVGGKMVDDLLK